MEPDFILDLDKEESLEQLAYISKIVSEKPKKLNKDALFLRNFMVSLFRVGEANYKRNIPKVEIKNEKPVDKLEIKKVEIKKPEVKLEMPTPLELPQPKFPEYPLIVTLDGKTIVKVRIRENTYYLDEPGLNENEKIILKDINKDVGSKLKKKSELLNDKNYLMDKFNKPTKKYNIVLDDPEYEKLRYYLIRDIIGFGKIDSLLKDGKIKEIICDGDGKNIILEYEDKTLSTGIILNVDEINEIINRFVEVSKQKLEKHQAHFETDVNGMHVEAILGLDIVSSKFIIKNK